MGPYFAVDKHGNVYAVNNDSRVLYQFTPDGTVSLAVDLEPLVHFATRLDISPTGDLFMTTSDTGGGVPVYELLLQLDADGRLKHVWPNGAEDLVAVDPRGDRLYMTGSSTRHRTSARRALSGGLGLDPVGCRRARPVTGKSVSVGASGLASVPVDRIVDPGLLALAARGDVGAFDEILRPPLARLYRMAVAITRSEPDARDAVQDASLNAWRELPRLRSPERFDSWLDQILVNACRSLMRRSRRVVVREIDLEAAGAATARRRRIRVRPGRDRGRPHPPGVRPPRAVRPLPPRPPLRRGAAARRDRSGHGQPSRARSSGACPTPARP